MYSAYNTCYYITANKALPSPSVAVTGDAFHYLGHAHAFYRWQGPEVGTEKQQECFNQSYEV